MKFCYQHTNYFSKEFNPAGLSEIVHYHRIKYIIFKSSSSKYNEVFHYYLYLIKKPPVYGSPFTQTINEAAHADQFQLHQATTPASPSSRHRHHHGPWVKTLLKQAPALQGYIDMAPLNQGLHKLEHRSSSLGNQCIHIFDCLQLYLQLDHTATPTICTKYQDHLHL